MKVISILAEIHRYVNLSDTSLNSTYNSQPQVLKHLSARKKKAPILEAFNK